MTQKKLSVWLKALIIGVGIALPVLVFLLLPTGTGSTRYFSMLFWGIAALPCFASLVFSWQIASQIARDRSFTERNALLLRRISVLAAADAAYLFVGETVRFLAGVDAPEALVLPLTVSAFGIVLSVAFAALSHLVRRAAALQADADLTV